MAGIKILLASDDPETSHFWAYSLNQRDIDVVVTQTAEEALHYWGRESFDLVIINGYSPHFDCIELCRHLRREVINPILLFTYEGDERYLLAAYEAGFDECIVKPVGLRLFLAKVTAWLRRAWTVPAATLGVLQAGDLWLDPMHQHLVMPEGKVIKLTHLEFRLVHLLLSHQGKVLETNLIVDRVWGQTGHGDSVLLKNVVYRLRRKIEPDPHHPRYLQTLAGEGYAFSGQ